MEIQSKIDTEDIGPEELTVQPVQKQRRGLCLKPYISEEAAAHLKEHKYSGADQGIFYVWFYNPVANKLVTYLPDTVAPNTLTLIGFCHGVVPAFILFTVYGTQLSGDVPSWFVFFQAWCFFSYRMFDEMDGKQARRTGNSSPLGLIFDHGCDAVTVGF